MIKSDNTPYNLVVSFTDSGVKRVKYTDDAKYWSKMVAMHGHLTNLSTVPLVLTDAQQSRLDSLPEDLQNVSLYVEYGTDEPDTPHYDAEAYKRAQEDNARPAIEYQRKLQEAKGVTYNGAVYSGDQSNRMALQEALTAAEDGDLTVFTAWKDSSGAYREDVPVVDVKSALRKIGQRRGHLISLEAQYVTQVTDGDVATSDLDWSTPYDGE